MADKKPLILDLHIPYAISPIRYIGGMQIFGSNDEKNAYLEAMIREVLSIKDELEEYEIRAVRLSGGAATVMKPDLLGRLLATVRKNLPVAARAEVSFDAIPNTIGTPSLTGIASGNPNRAELMIRSYREEDLAVLKCPFSLQNVKNAMLFFNRFRFNNVGLTVHYGIPGQSMKDWEFTVRTCANLAAPHITLAPLLVTDAEGMPEEETRFAMFKRGCELLVGAGYEHYALGLFCRRGLKYCFETLSHDGCEVLGLGANAISRMDGYLTRNTNHLGIYIRYAGDFKKVTAQCAVISKEDAAGFYAAGRLGLLEGLDNGQLEARFGSEVQKLLKERLESLQEKEWIAAAENGYVPTLSGLFHYPEVCRMLLEK